MDTPYNLYAHLRMVSADALSPLFVYSQLRQHFAKAILFENEIDGYTYLGALPIAGAQVSKNQLYLYLPDGAVRQSEFVATESQNEQIRAFMAEFVIVPTNPQVPLPAEVQAFWGYQNLDKTLAANLHYQLFRYHIFINHLQQTAYLVELTTSPDTQTLDKLDYFIRQAVMQTAPFKPQGEWTAFVSDEIFSNSIRTCFQACRDGLVYEMQLFKRWSVPFGGDVWQVFRALRKLQPSNYRFFADFGSYEIFGTSATLQCSIQNNTVTVCVDWQWANRTDEYEQDMELLKAMSNATNSKSVHYAYLDATLSDLSKLGTWAEATHLGKTEFLQHRVRLASYLEAKTETMNWLEWHAATFPKNTEIGIPRQNVLNLYSQLEQAWGLSFGYGNNAQQALFMAAQQLWISQNNVLHTATNMPISANLSKEKLQQDFKNNHEWLQNLTNEAQNL